MAVKTHLEARPHLLFHIHSNGSKSSCNEEVSKLAIDKISEIGQMHQLIDYYTFRLLKTVPHLKEKQIYQIYHFIANNKEGLLTKVKELGKDLYIRPIESGLARAIQITTEGRVFIHLNRKKLGDPVLGHGSYKMVKTAIDLETAEVFASASLKYNSAYYQDSEIKNLEELKGVPGFVQLVAKASYPLKSNRGRLLKELKERVILVEYETNLSKAIDSGNLTATDNRKIFEGLVRSLHYLHSHNKLHRDLKPENVLLDIINEPVLADFGSMCHTTESTKLRKNRTTRWYASPEFASAMLHHPFDNKKLEEATRKPLDMWGLGCILYRLLGMDKTYGPLPWRTDSEETTYQTLANLPPNWLKEPSNKNSPEHLVWEMLHVDSIPKVPKIRITVQQALARLKKLEW